MKPAFDISWKSDPSSVCWLTVVRAVVSSEDNVRICIARTISIALQPPTVSTLDDQTPSRVAIVGIWVNSGVEVCSTNPSVRWDVILVAVFLSIAGNVGKIPLAEWSRYNWTPYLPTRPPQAITLESLSLPILRACLSSGKGIGLKQSGTALSTLRREISTSRPIFVFTERRYLAARIRIRSMEAVSNEGLWAYVRIFILAYLLSTGKLWAWTSLWNSSRSQSRAWSPGSSRRHSCWNPLPQCHTVGDGRNTRS